ncbi:MAG TPA: class I SAM-dependent methyltransferase [Acidimicrobiales bacterium]|nr:class I SAM-dependent methyltransferase [Acidimicrobiales bacterium]
MAEADFSRVSRCRLCGASSLFSILDLGRQPLANALVPSGSPPPARYPLAVVGCGGCGVMQLNGTVNPRVMFDDYLYFSSYSESMLSAMRSLAARTTERFGIGPSDLVMEIASNDGYLLGHYRDLGVRVLGIEPAANVASVAQEAGIETCVDYFTAELASELRLGGCRPRVIHANNVLAHVPDIHDLVEGIGILLDDDGAAIIETPYLLDLIDRGLFETIYHEHVFYYSLGALQYLFGEHGMSIQDCEHLDVHGGSLRITVRKGNKTRPTRRAARMAAAEALRGLKSQSAYALFVAEVSQARAEVVNQLRQVKSSGRTLAGYGAAAKATVLLNFAHIDRRTIDYVIDRNPAKQGRLIPGVDIPVVPIEHLRENPPDVLAVLVWNLADEVRSQLQWYTAAGGELIVPLEERRGLDRGTASRAAPAHSR